MKVYKVIFVAALAFVSISCFWSEEKANENASVESHPANQTINSEIKTEEKAALPDDSVTQVETEIIPKTEEIKSLKTPTNTYKTFAVATFNKDVATIKQSLSKGSLQFIEEAARAQNSTVAEMLTGGAVAETARKIPEIKNEQIDGDRATIDVKNQLGTYDKIPLVRENGEWKVALDQLNREAQRKLEEIKKKLSEIR